jgi:hypothetical protein
MTLGVVPEYKRQRLYACRKLPHLIIRLNCPVLSCSLPANRILYKFVEESDRRQMSVEMDAFIDGMEIVNLFHGSRHETIDMRRHVPVIYITISFLLEELG